MTPTLKRKLKRRSFFLKERTLGPKNYLFAFFGGGIGASARYWLSGVVYNWLPASFPYGNLAVNITGCFLIGVLMAVMQERFPC